jgi:spore coat polysaccharide biosynthesis predicted glycosyltransferase SpsG
VGLGHPPGLEDRVSYRTNSGCVFRVAAGPRLGFGHLMRVRALARALGVEPTLSIRGGVSARRAAAAIGRVVRDAAALDGARLLVVDDPGERHGRAWVRRARQRNVPCISIHDEAWAHDADLVVAPGLDAPRPETAAAVLYGPDFYLLDPSIAGLRRTRATGARRVLVALGGGRHVHRLAQPLADAIGARCPDAMVEIAAGFSPRRPELRGARWVTASSGLAPLLSSADVAVVAGGVTLYEACALGVPTVGLAVVPPQRRAIRAFARQRALIDAGLAGADGRAIRAAANGVARLLGDRRLRAATGTAARRLIDGRGAARIAARASELLARNDPHA